MSADVRWIRLCGQIDDAERERVRNTELYLLGDVIPVWVNEGDILMHTNMDPPSRKLCGTCRRAGVVKCWDLDCDFRDDQQPLVNSEDGR